MLPSGKDTRFWTGFLLLVRCALFLTFAFNVLGNASINLLTITSVTVGLTVLAWLQNRLYNERFNDILEACFMLNLCIFAAATYHVREIEGRQDKLAYTSVGIAFVILIYIIIYHVFRRISKTKIWKMLSKESFSDHNKIRKSLQGIKSKTKHREQKDIVQNKQIAETAQVPLITVIELSEPMLEY